MTRTLAILAILTLTGCKSPPNIIGDALGSIAEQSAVIDTAAADTLLTIGKVRADIADARTVGDAMLAELGHITGGTAYALSTEQMLASLDAADTGAAQAEQKLKAITPATATIRKSVRMAVAALGDTDRAEGEFEAIARYAAFGVAGVAVIALVAAFWQYIRAGGRVASELGKVAADVTRSRAPADELVRVARMDPKVNKAYQKERHRTK